MLDTAELGFLAPSSSEPFLLLNENRFAYTAVQKTLERNPWSQPHLIFIHGPSGTGKSHLMRFALRELRQQNRDVQCFQVTTSEFAAQLAAAAEAKSIHEFQEHYRKQDCLVFEDLPALEGRFEVQLQLINCIDHLLSMNAKVLITSQKSPGELQEFLPRLTNRCHGGSCAEITIPGANSRAKLISHFARTRQIPIPSDVAQFLAEQLPLAPRELLSNVIQMELRARMKNTGIINRRLARQFLNTEVSQNHPDLCQIAKAVSRQFDVSVANLRSSTRMQGRVVPRHCAMLLARELTELSLSEIAAYFGKRNHSTVIHACHRIREMLPENPALRQQIASIRRSLLNPIMS